MSLPDPYRKRDPEKEEEGMRQTKEANRLTDQLAEILGGKEKLRCNGVAARWAFLDQSVYDDYVKELFAEVRKAALDNLDGAGIDALFLKMHSKYPIWT